MSVPAMKAPMRRRACSSSSSSAKTVRSASAAGVESAPQRHLGLGVQQRARAGQVTFVVIGVQQAGRCPAVNLGGQLPRQVDRVEHPRVDRDAAGRELVCRIAGQQDPPVAVPVGLPGADR